MTRTNAGRDEVWSPLRKKWVALTPEESVRQTLVQHLLAAGVPQALMAEERAITVDGRPRRFDLLVFDRTGAPTLLAECKAPTEPLTDAVLHQLANYNRALAAPWLVVTNGPVLWAFVVTATGPQHSTWPALAADIVR